MIKRYYKREIDFSLIPFLRFTEAEKKHTSRHSDERITQFFSLVRNRKLSMGLIQQFHGNFEQSGSRSLLLFPSCTYAYLIRAHCGVLRSIHSPQTRDAHTSLHPYRILTSLSRKICRLITASCGLNHQ